MEINIKRAFSSEEMHEQEVNRVAQKIYESRAKLFKEKGYEPPGRPERMEIMEARLAIIERGLFELIGRSDDGNDQTSPTH